MARAQAFGRFGYTDTWKVPNMRIDRAGISAEFPTADRLRFVQTLSEWKPVYTSDTEQIVAVGNQPLVPSKLQYSLLSPGVFMLFDQGLALRLNSTAAPYLSWKDGSVDVGVPTPNVRWLVISFRDSQPPLVIGFVGQTSSLKITGQPGNWTLEGSNSFNGWIHVALPVGNSPIPANSVGTLGRLALQASANEALWSQPAPSILKRELESDDDAVTATWTFDRPNAIVPQAASLSVYGDYPLKILSQIRRPAFLSAPVPINVCQGKQLKIRFPVRRIPVGRGLGIGGDPGEPIGTVSSIDYASVAELALEMLSAGRDSQTRHSAEATVADYLSEAAYTTEPYSNQLLPFNALGQGLDLAAAQAFLVQASISSSKQTTEDNSLLTSVAWRRDWATWLPWTADSKVRRRAAAFCALAGAMSADPERRLWAGMFQAGLSAEKGLQIFERRKGIDNKNGPLPEPLYAVRRGIFRLEQLGIQAANPFDRTLFSPIRVFGDISLKLIVRDNQLILQWTALEPKASVITFISAYEIKLEPLLNLPRFKVDESPGLTEVSFTPEVTGTCEMRLTIPVWAKELPKAVPIPRYSE